MTLSCNKKTISIIKRNNIKALQWFFIVWIAFILLQPKKKIELHGKVSENKFFCNVIMPSEDTKILELEQYQKSDKAAFIIYAGLECIIDKILEKLWNYQVLKLLKLSGFRKTMENNRKHRDIKLVRTERRRNYLVSQPHYHTTKFFTEKLLLIKMKKTDILMNKPVHLGLSIQELSKKLMYEFWYDYVKPKFSEKIKLLDGYR